MEQPTSIETPRFSEFQPEHDKFERFREKSPRRWILAHIFHGSNKLIILVWFCFEIVYSILESLLAVEIGRVIEVFTVSGSSVILPLAAWILFLGALVPCSALVANLMRELIAQRMERDVRREYYRVLLGKSQSFHDAQRIGDLMSRATKDVRQLNELISPAVALIGRSAISSIVPLIFIALGYPVQLLLVPATYLLLFVWALRFYIRKLDPVTTRLQELFGDLNAVLNEELAGIEVVKGMVQETGALETYMKTATEYRDYEIQEGTIQARYWPLLMVAVAITLGLTHSILLQRQGLLSLGEIISYVGLLFMLQFPTNISIWAFVIVSRAGAGTRRLLETMGGRSEIGNPLNPVTKVIAGKVSFQNVTFHYPGTENDVLHDISFEIQPGQTIAIVGTTGSGKTTLTKLLSRLYDVQKGQILVDDLDIRQYDLQSLRSQIAYIEQDIFLFSDSIYQNIVFGRDAPLERVIEVAHDAQAHEFISTLPEGYETEVGERGVQLSGGERQRVAIARAFLSDPKILVLDDSTSAIDSATEEKIQAAISRVQQGRTTFLITHRLSQIRWADHILVFKRGSIVAQGAHQELLRTSEEYRNIFVKRFDKSLTELLEECG